MWRINYLEATSIMDNPESDDSGSRHPASERQFASIPMIKYVEKKDYSLYYGISFLVLVLCIAFFSYKYLKKKY